MALHIRDERTDALVRELAARKGIGLTEAVREAVESELARQPPKQTLLERLRPLLDEIHAMPRVGPKADKAFFDALWGQKED
jgi:antitoxin VapB